MKKNFINEDVLWYVTPVDFIKLPEYMELAKTTAKMRNGNV